MPTSCMYTWAQKFLHLFYIFIEMELQFFFYWLIDEMHANITLLSLLIFNDMYVIDLDSSKRTCM